MNNKFDVCVFCEKEPVKFMILDTWTEPPWRQMIKYVGENCMKSAVIEKVTNPENKYALYWLVLRRIWTKNVKMPHRADFVKDYFPLGSRAKK